MDFATYGALDGEGPDEDAMIELAGWSAPENELPVPVAQSAVLWRGDGLVVALVGGHAHRTGIELHVTVRQRVEEPAQGPQLHQLMGGPPGVDDARLVLGVGYADGRRGSTLRRHETLPTLPGEPEPLSVRDSSGGGGATCMDLSYWVRPVPPPGPLTIAVWCEALGIDETVTTLDGTAWAEAASRVEVLWPWHFPTPSAWEPPRPNLPAGGWFEQSLGDELGEAPT
jgi:hypothetical protein